MEKKNLFFDLDGTIIDSSEGIYGSILYALDKMAKPGLTDEQLRSFIGPPLVDSFLNIGFTPEEAEQATVYYRETYAVKGMYEVKVYEGIPEALAVLADKYDLYIATSKPEHFAKKILANIQLARYFTGIYGADSETDRTAKADVLAYALAESGAEAPASVMIGDRSHDMLGAAQCQVLPVGVLWGFGDRQELTESGAAEILTVPADLLTAFISA